MSTIATILEEAAKLNTHDLRELQNAIADLERERRTFVLKPKTRAYRLCRLTNEEFRTLLPRSIAIEEDLFFQLHFTMAMWRKNEGLRLVDVYVALRSMTGETSPWLDDWKQAFSFPFRLQFEVGANECTYLWEIRNVRDSLYFPFRKVVAKEDPRLENHSYYAPIADEFSKDEMNELIVHLYGYMQGYLEVLPSSFHPPFIRAVQASRLVLGCRDGELFQQQYDSEEKFYEALQRYQAEFEETSSDSADPDVVIEE